VDDVTGGTLGDVAAGFRIEDSAPDRAFEQVVGGDRTAPTVELTRDWEVLGGALVHRADDLHGGLAPSQHVGLDLAREADEVGDDLQGKLAGERVDRLEAAGGGELTDERIRLLVDLAREAAERAR